MTELMANGPNAQQIEYWNEVSGPRWVEMGDVIDAQIAPLGEAAMDRAGLETGHRVLDIGCGCGQTTLGLAARVGDPGSVLGLDISGPMLARAADRAREEGVSNARFEQADAQTFDFGGDKFDRLFSRFGVMFFASPGDAFTNLRTALRPGGRLTFVCWQKLDLNPWMHLPILAAAKHLPPAGPPPEPNAPGPFAFADANRVRDMLRDSGFTKVEHESFEMDLLIGGGAPLDQAVRFIAQLGPTAAALRDATPELKSTVMDEIQSAIEGFQQDDGVRIPSATWIVSAERPV
jgi:SAM-dependent methyltransferase